MLYDKVKQGIALIVASGALALSSCSSAPHRSINPQFEQKISSSTEWNKYITECHDLCLKSWKESLDGKEEKFYRLIEWLNGIAGQEYDPKNFDIVSDSALERFTSEGFVGLLMPDGICWNDTLLIRNRPIDLETISHERGHIADAHLSNWDYAFSTRARVRNEAVAEAFRHYAGLELIRRGNCEGTYQLINGTAERNDYRNLDEVLAGNTYNAARCLTAILMLEYNKMGKVWLFLAKAPKEEVYRKIDEILLKVPDIQTAILGGYLLIDEEKSETNKEAEKIEKEGWKRRYILPQKLDGET